MDTSRFITSGPHFGRIATRHVFVRDAAEALADWHRMFGAATDVTVLDVDNNPELRRFWKFHGHVSYRHPSSPV